MKHMRELLQQLNLWALIVLIYLKCASIRILKSENRQDVLHDLLLQVLPLRHQLLNLRMLLTFYTLQAISGRHWNSWSHYECAKLSVLLISYTVFYAQLMLFCVQVIGLCGLGLGILLTFFKTWLFTKIQENINTVNLDFISSVYIQVRTVYISWARSSFPVDRAQLVISSQKYSTLTCARSRSVLALSFWERSSWWSASPAGSAPAAALKFCCWSCATSAFFRH